MYKSKTNQLMKQINRRQDTLLDLSLFEPVSSLSGDTKRQRNAQINLVKKSLPLTLL
jgi:hypothetical protein